MKWKKMILQFAIRILKYLGIFLSGFLITYSLAPYHQWYLGVIGTSLLFYFLEKSRPQKYLGITWLFGLGVYLSGASWVFVAIHEFAYTPIPLAIVLTGIFVTGMGLVFAIPFLLYGKYVTFTNSRHSYLAFPAFWVIGEWTRNWFLTGFPWLYLGYAHVDTWLSGWAPVLGVMGLSFLAVLSGTLIVKTLRQKKHLLTSGGVIITIWLTGLILHQITWTHKSNDEPISVAIVQPNIPLEIKWDPNFRDYILEVLRTESQDHWGKDIILWPEAAVPLLRQDAELILKEFDKLARENNSSLVTGMLHDDPETGKVYNSIISIGNGTGTYFKQRLVPFGEYVPLEGWLRGLISFFDLPNSFIYPGPKTQAKLLVGKHSIAPFICYEIVYPGLVAKSAKSADLMVTISNDAWFGNSIGPLQHMQMAQMRALENERFLVRATNTGVSGVVDPKGKILFTGPQFVQENFVANVEKRAGFTPFSLLGSYPIVIICFIFIGTTMIPALKTVFQETEKSDE